METETQDILPRFFTFQPNVFRGRFFFYFGPWTHWRELRGWYLTHGLTDEGNFFKEDTWTSRTGAMTEEPCLANPIIVMQAVPNTPQEIADLVHEIHHAVQRYTNSLGIYTHDNSEEVFAYLEGSLTQIVLDYLWHGVVAPGLDNEEDNVPAPD